MNATWNPGPDRPDYAAVEVHVSTDPSFRPSARPAPQPSAWDEFWGGFAIAVCGGVLVAVVIGCLVLLSGL